MKHFIQISGGKDSQAVAKIIRNRYPDSKLTGIFCDTGYEHELTYAHVDKIAKLYDLEMIKINAGTVAEQVAKWGRFPGGGARHCTDYLKIQPVKKFLISTAIKAGNTKKGFSNNETILNYLGMRSDESPARTVRYYGLDNTEYKPHEVMPSKCPKYMGALGIRYSLPIIDWTTEDVFTFLEGEHNPLYDLGFDRVGCFPCLASGDKWKMKAFNLDATGEKHYKIAKELEKITVKAGNRPLFNTQIGKKMECEKEGIGCSFCSI